MRDQTTMIAIPLQNIPKDEHRTFLNVIPEADGPGVDVTISGGTTFHIEEDNSWGPQPCPMNDIEFSGTGTIIYCGSIYD